MVTPETRIKLLNVPLDTTQQHQLYFPDPTEQAIWFASQAVKSYEEATYARPEGYLRIPEKLDSLYQVNYCMYQNSAAPGKWFYAFVTRMEYKNESLSLLYLETDVFQTWFNDCTLLPSFVEREHEDET